MLRLVGQVGNGILDLVSKYHPAKHWPPEKELCSGGPWQAHPPQHRAPGRESTPFCRLLRQSLNLIRRKRQTNLSWGAHQGSGKGAPKNWNRRQEATLVVNLAPVNQLAGTPNPENFCFLVCKVRELDLMMPTTKFWLPKLFYQRTGRWAPRHLKANNSEGNVTSCGLWWLCASAPQ